MSPEWSAQCTMQADFPATDSLRESPGPYVGYLAAAGVMVDDLSGDGTVHVGEERLGVAVRRHAAVHHH